MVHTNLCWRKSKVFVFWLVQTWSRLPGGNLLVPHGVLYCGLHWQVRQTEAPDWFNLLSPSFSSFTLPWILIILKRLRLCFDLFLLPISPQFGQFAAMWSDFRQHHGGGRQGELHDCGGGLHGWCKDYRQRPDPLQVCFAQTRSAVSHTVLTATL